MNFNTSPRRPSDPRVVVVIVLFGAMLTILLCAVMPFVWAAWRAKP